jgi:hypothetical protein
MSTISKLCLLEKAELRNEVLRFLALRPAVAYPPDVIHRRLVASKGLDFDPTVEDVVEALMMLKGLEFVLTQVDQLGSQKFYQATSAGVLALERGTLTSET